MSVNHTASGVGRFTALVLGLVVFVCVAMIGGTGYLKYQLDRSETVLAAPDSALSSDQSAPAAATARLEAQNELQYWAMLLTLTCWSSLIIAAACAAGIYLTLRDKHSAPMRALAQSIQNMARGDMRTAIWGVERQDVIGELARAMDIARYHFSHLPDVSLLSEQGPVRMRFEGGARSLFEAMMKAISGDSENIRTQSSALTDAVKQQNESISSLSEKVENILLNITQRGQNGEMQITQAITDMIGSAENLKNAHAHAADQLNRLIPNIQDRAQGLAEITHIAGKQITQTLQSLASSDISLKANAEEAKETMAKLASTADDLGTRLFGAINLLQASGKVMAETTENIKARLGETATPVPAQDVAQWDERLAEITRQLASLQTKMDAQRIASPQSAAGEYVLAPLAAQMEQITGQLETLQIKLDDQSDAQSGLYQMNEKIVALTESLPATLNLNAHEVSPPSASQDGIAALSDKIAELAELNGRVAVFAAALPGDMRQAVREELQALSEKNDDTDLRQKIDELAELNGRVAVFASAFPGDMRQAVREELQVLSEQNGVADLREKISELADLNGRVAVFASALPGDMRQAVREEMQGMSGQNDIAALGEKLATLQAEIEKTQASTPEMAQHVGEIGMHLAAQIDSLRTVIGTTLQNEITTKLATFEETLTATQRIAEATQAEMAKPAPSYTLPPELQKQFLDQWFQMSAQIEASRASLSDALAEEIKQMESRVTEKQSLPPKKTTADFALQIQIEKQTEILGELIATLSLLDAHVQQINAAR